jgi:hypothetical protein
MKIMKKTLNALIAFYLALLMSSCLSQNNDKLRPSNSPEKFGFDSKVFIELINDVKAKDINLNSLYIFT